MADDRGELGIAIDAFLLNLRARSYSPATVTTYAFDLGHLLERVGEVDPASLTSHHIRRALAGLHARGSAPKTLARTLSAWRSFFNWLARQDRVEANPCLGLRPPKGDKRLPNALSVDEMALLLEPEPEDTVWSRRDTAMFELMYSSGLRRAELIGLDLGQVDMREAEVHVLGKGSKARKGTLAQRVRKDLKVFREFKEWLGQRGQREKQEQQERKVHKVFKV